jgi:hypothetical protein
MTTHNKLYDEILKMDPMGSFAIAIKIGDADFVKFLKKNEGHHWDHLLDDGQDLYLKY